MEESPALAAANNEYTFGDNSRASARLRRLAEMYEPESRALLQRSGMSAPRLAVDLGCGPGWSTRLLQNVLKPGRTVGLDASAAYIEEAKARHGASLEFEVHDIAHAPFPVHAPDFLFSLPFEDASFDDVFVCFVLEHLADPGQALAAVRRMLKPGGTITVIEGDHGSWYCHPQTAEATRTVQCLIEIQARLGGDSLIGRRLYPLLAEAGFRHVRVDPRMVYVDDSLPHLVEGFSRNTFIAMVEGVREEALSLGLMDTATWDKGIANMYRAAEPGGTFCYTFFRGCAVR